MADESLELDGVLGYLGIEASSMDELKEVFENDFIRKSNVRDHEGIVNDIVGRRMGQMERKVRQSFKTAGFALDDLDTTDKNVEELIAMGIDNMNTQLGSKVSELEDQVLNSSDENYKKLEDKYGKLHKKYTETIGLLDDTRQEYSALEERSRNQVKDITIKTMRTQAMGKINFRDNISTLERNGFDSLINAKYQIDLEDSGELVVTNSKGERIKHPEITGQFMGLDDILKAEAIENNLWKVNENGGAPASKFASFGTTQEGSGAQQVEGPKRQINGNFRK